MVSRSAASPRKFGSIAGRPADRRCRARRCRGFWGAAGRHAARSRCRGGACGRDRRPSPCRNAAGCRARRDRDWFSGSRRIRRSSMSSVRGARAGIAHAREAAARCRFERHAVEIRIVRHVAEHEIRMVLQVLSDAGQMMPAGNAVFCQCGGCRRRPTASAVAGSGTRRRQRSLRAARGSVLSLCPAGIRRRPRACLRTGCGWPAPGFRRANWRGCPYADGDRPAPRSSVRRSSASPDRCRGLHARRH